MNILVCGTGILVCVMNILVCGTGILICVMDILVSLWNRHFGLCHEHLSQFVEQAF
ncbi:MAG: hypothetical protein QNJ47_13330 [Nostocaceae cyanobacterium]|nr:hypothetical protein [Nostocaceae cyanobacterium]